MHIQLDDQTKSWLQAKGKPVSIKILHVNSCCAPPIQDVMTSLGKPKNVHHYKEFEIDGVSVFVEKSLTYQESILLKLTGIGIFKTITAKLK